MQVLSRLNLYIIRIVKTKLATQLPKKYHNIYCIRSICKMNYSVIQLHFDFNSEQRLNRIFRNLHVSVAL